MLRQNVIGGTRLDAGGIIGLRVRLVTASGWGGSVTVVLLAVVAVLLLGLPLLALGMDRLLPQFKARPVTPGPLQLLARRYTLVPRDLIEVQAAVAEGRAAHPPRLAPATVDHATWTAALDMWDRPVVRKQTVSARTRRVLLVIWPVLIVGYLIDGIIIGNAFSITLGGTWLAGTCVMVPLQRTAWRRRTAAALSAIVANDTTSVEASLRDGQ